MLIDSLVYRGPKGNGTRRGRAARFCDDEQPAAARCGCRCFLALVCPGSACCRPTRSRWSALFLLRFLLSDRVIYGAPATADDGGRPRPGPHCWSTAAPVRDRRLRPRRSQLPAVPLRHRRHGHHRLPDPAARAGVLPRPVGRRRRTSTSRSGSATSAARPAAPAGRHDASSPTRPALRYEEHLGRLGANFRVDLGDHDQRHRRPAAGPLAARRLHQHRRGAAALRAGLAAGRMLLHSACVELDGVGVMLSARTDTGKTGTSCGCCASTAARFLSDDMTIVDAGRHRACASPSR